MRMSSTMVVIIQKPKPRKYIDLLTIIKVSGAWLKTKKIDSVNVLTCNEKFAIIMHCT